MSRALPLLFFQAAPRSPATAVEELRNELIGRLADFPATRLAVYPEFNVCAVKGTPRHGARRTRRLRNR